LGADAVVAALMQAGVERPVAEGLATTSTAELVTTAIADAKRRRDVENVPGYIVYLVRNPGHLRSRQQRRREQSRANLAESEQELRAAADERAAARAVGEREAVEMVRALSPANREHWRGIVVSATEEDWKKQAWAAADPLTMPTLCIEIARRLKSAGKDPRIKVAAQAAANRNPSTPSATRRT
jgi:hypothetical protein